MNVSVPHARLVAPALVALLAGCAAPRQVAREARPLPPPPAALAAPQAAPDDDGEWIHEPAPGAGARQAPGSAGAGRAAPPPGPDFETVPGPETIPAAEPAPAVATGPLAAALPAPAAAPPGALRVEIASGRADQRWDVYVDDEVVCSTPCTRWLDPARPLSLRARAGRGLPPDLLHISDLGAAADGASALRVRAHPTRLGRLATGITVTSLGGMAALTGITLAAVGCTSDEHRGMCTAGAVAGALGAFGVGGGVKLILDARPRADVEAAPPLDGGRTGIVVGPGFVAGRFR